MALEAHISPATLSRIEAGVQHPSPDTLYQLASCLQGINYEELLAAAEYLIEDKQASTELSSLKGYLILSDQIIKLSADEEEYLQNSLEMYRLWKQKKQAKK
ncbi:helix-turn-helix transcriptional regulator [Paenibacillus sp. CC-CFT747]|nr:helix-turn-helix transcriptional regulator [Paenibacillus sp. CC-CFT747]